MSENEQWSLFVNAPKTMLKYCFFFLLCFVAGVVTVSAQRLPPEELPEGLPEEYDPDEFPFWTQDLRRFEVITVGTFPLTYLFTSLIYDFSIYASNNFDTQYSLGSQRSSRDIGIIVGSAGAVSLVLATIDLIINLDKRNRQEAAEDD